MVGGPGLRQQLEGYPAFRAKVASGDVVAFRGRGLLAWVIRTWTRGSYAHVALAWRLGGRVLLLESRASRHGVSIHRTLSQAYADAPTVVPTGVPWTEVNLVRALRDLGQPYGWLDAVRAGFGLRPALRGRQCAEYVAEVLGLDPDIPWTPVRLVQALRAQASPPQ